MVELYKIALDFGVSFNHVPKFWKVSLFLPTMKKLKAVCIIIYNYIYRTLDYCCHLFHLKTC